MDVAKIQDILNRIEYKNWAFFVNEDKGALYLQLRFLAPDNLTGEDSLQSCRRWLLSRHMTPSEIVGTALKAVITAEEHEAREQFRYKGEAVFGPHIDVEALLVAAKKEDRRALVG